MEDEPKEKPAVDSDDEPLINICKRAAAAATIVETFVCDTCGPMQPSRTALQMHQAVMHGKRSDIRLHVRETFCTICGLESHCRTMMMNHLERSLVCKANTKNRHLPMTEAEAL